MTIQLQPQFTTGRIDNGAGGWMLSYEIEYTRRDDGVWFMRYTYFCDERLGGELVPPRVDPWIHAPWSKNDPPSNFRPVHPSITCPKCGMISYHPKDVEARYCANCHEFHGRYGSGKVGGQPSWHREQQHG